MFKVIFIFPEWILIKQILFPQPFSVVEWDRRLENAAWAMSNFSLPRVWLEKLGKKVRVGNESWVKMARFNAFSGNMNTINLKIFPIHSGIWKWFGIWKSESKFYRHSEERLSPKGFAEILQAETLGLEI